jgi:uroporphyrinogen decarboxylase
MTTGTVRIGRTLRAGASLFSFFKEFTKFSLPYLTEINRRVKESLAAQKLPVVPMIVFAKGAHYALTQLGQSGYEVVGLDWTIRPEEARRLVGDNVSLQVPVPVSFIY